MVMMPKTSDFFFLWLSEPLYLLCKLYSKGVEIFTTYDKTLRVTCAPAACYTRVGTLSKVGNALFPKHAIGVLTSTIPQGTKVCPRYKPSFAY